MSCCNIYIYIFVATAMMASRVLFGIILTFSLTTIILASSDEMNRGHFHKRAPQGIVGAFATSSTGKINICLWNGNHG
jgi:hypothetical protein